MAPRCAIPSIGPRSNYAKSFIGITGQNVVVSIVDDGLDMYSDDLKDNYVQDSFSCSQAQY